MTCDWCGNPFAEGETPVSGYEDQPTHKACERAALKGWNRDRGMHVDEFAPRDREPFTDWPNGQGTYD